MHEWQSNITAIRPGRMVTYGYDQLDIIRSFSFEEVVFLLLQGRRPDSVEKELLRAVLVAHVSHGITGQSTLAVRMAADCRSSFLHALIAGFSTGAGVYHQGGLQATMVELQELARLEEHELTEMIEGRLQSGKRMMGFGHRYHKEFEPRSEALMNLVRELGYLGRHVSTALKIGSILSVKVGIPMNIEAAGGAILLDLGFRPEIAHLFIVLGRSSMLAAAYQERLDEGTRPFPRLKVFDES